VGKLNINVNITLHWTIVSKAGSLQSMHRHLIAYTPRWFTCPQTYSHPSNSSNHLRRAFRPEVKLSTWWSWVWRPNGQFTLRRRRD